MSLTPAHEGRSFASSPPPETAKDKSLPRLRVLARKKRSCGSVTIDRQFRSRRTGSIGYLDSYVTELGFQPIEQNWVKVERDEAVRLMRHAMQWRLSRRTLVMNSVSARRIVSRFMSYFDRRSVQFYTNVEHFSGEFQVWQPISRAPFDMGIVAFDEKGIGMLWVEDTY